MVLQMWGDVKDSARCIATSKQSQSDDGSRALEHRFSDSGVKRSREKRNGRRYHCCLEYTRKCYRSMHSCHKSSGCGQRLAS